MNGNATIREASGANRFYFFLSYAHSPTISEYPEADADRSVREFFSDLAAAVRHHASRQSEFDPGFFDQQIPAGSDWKASLSQALGVAQVFVPLYSARYLSQSWPGREWACFRQRVELAGQADPERRFAPVLWTPLPGTVDPPGLREALAIGADAAGYAENGLRALLKIRSYRDSYHKVVNLLAKRIVTLAEESPIGPSEVPDIDEMVSIFTPRTRQAVFAIETAAPTARTVAAGHDARGYSESSSGWRPFPQHELPVAEYAKQIAERFDFKAEVSGIKTVAEPRTRRPGIILIDPWFIADEKGRSSLKSALENLPRWVLPLLVLDQSGDTRTQKLADQVREILSAANALPTDSSRRGARGVKSLDEFISIVRVLVVEAERQYMRYRSGRYQHGQALSSVPSTRPSLRRPMQPTEPSSTPYPLRETPDA